MNNTEAEKQQQEIEGAAETSQKAGKNTRREPSPTLVEALAYLANGSLDKCLEKVIAAIIEDVIRTGHAPNAKFLMDVAALVDGRDDEVEDDEEIYQSFAEFLWNQL